MTRQFWFAIAAAGAMIAFARNLPAQATASSPAATGSWTVVSYLSGGSVYLDVGSVQGVREGLALDVVRHGATIAQLTAKYVSSNHTACTISSSTADVAVGDSVRYQPVHEAVAAARASAATSPAARSRRAPIRGRIGVRYLVIQTADGSTLTQPAVDLRLDGAQVNGTSLGVAVDVRAQRTALTGASAAGLPSEGLTRVYQAAMTYQPGAGRARWAVGRQFATALSPIGIFDGAALDVNGDRWSGGALAGTEPDAVSFAPSGATTEYGLWIQRHNRPGTHAPWTATVGAIGSYDRGEIDREFVYLRGTYNSRRFSLYAAEEVDANRGWKRAVEGSAITLTSTFATAQFNAGDALTMSAGFDSRRSVRLYRDFVNPETVFDDAFRQGSWGEVDVRVSRHLRLSTDARLSSGGVEGQAQAVTASLWANRLTRLGLGLRVRATRYTGPLSEGVLASGELEASPSNAVRISINAGERTSAVPGSGLAATRLTWTGADVDVALGRSVYLLLSTYRETGTPTASIQSYGALSWRF